MGKEKPNEKNNLFDDQDGTAAVQNQLNKSYQKGVIEDQLENNRGIHTFNNQKK